MRKSLLSALGPDNDDAMWDEVSDYMTRANTANAAATSAGRIKVRAITRVIMTSDTIADEDRAAVVMDEWMDLLLQSDDESSGRRNNLRRAFQDGVRDEVRRLRWSLRAELTCS